MCEPFIGPAMDVMDVRARIRSVPLWVGVAVWAGSLALYLSTVAPTLTWGWDDLGIDGGDLLAAAKTFGVPHPTGYPTYTLLLRLFATIVPIGDFAFRGNLLSAVLASATVLTVYWSVYRFCVHLKPDAPVSLRATGAALGASVLATAPLFWSQANVTEVYALNALIAAALLLIAVHMALPAGDPNVAGQTRPPPARTLAVFGLLLGLGVGNHFTVLAVAIPLVVWLWSSLGRRAVVSPWAIGAFVAGFSVYLYLPISASQHPPISWGNADTLGGFAWMLTGGPYQGYVFAVPADSLLSCSSDGCSGRIVAWVELMFEQFNPLGLFLGITGAVVLRSRAVRFLVLSLLPILGLSVYSVTYNTVDSEVLNIPALLLFSVWAGIGAFWVLAAWITDPESDPPGAAPRRLAVSGRPLRVALAALAFALLPGTAILLNYGSQDLSDDRGAYRYAKALLDAVPDGSVLVSEDERSVFSLWYIRYVEMPHRDVAPVVLPLLQFDWYREDIRRMYPDRIPDIAQENAIAALRGIIEHDGGRARVFATFTSAFLSVEFDVERVGNVFEISPRDEG